MEDGKALLPARDRVISDLRRVVGLNDGVDQRHACPVRLSTQKRPLPTRSMNTAAKW
jgi:hypothetical protein